MNYIYSFFALVLISYIFTRKFDFLSIGGISFIVYTIYSVIGEVGIPRGAGFYYYDSISTETYSIVIFQLFVILSYILINDKVRIQSVKKIKYSQDPDTVANKLAFSWLLVFAVLATLKNILTVGIEIFQMHKSDIMSEMDIFYGLAIWSALVVLTYAIDRNSKKLIIFSSVIILMNLIIGSRAYLATAIIIFIMLKWKNITKANFKIFALGITSISALFIYKQIYQDVRKLDIETVVSKLMDTDTYINALQLGEPSIVMSIYNYIINSNYQLDFVDSSARILSVIPFINNFLPITEDIRFSAIVKNDIFESTYGLASSFWAESYSMLGYIGVFIFTILWLMILRKGTKCLYIPGIRKYFLIPGISYLSFYIHRLDYVQTMGAFKSLLLVYFVWLSIKQLTARLTKIRNGRPYDRKISTIRGKV